MDSRFHYFVSNVNQWRWGEFKTSLSDPRDAKILLRSSTGC